MWVSEWSADIDSPIATIPRARISIHNRTFRHHLKYVHEDLDLLFFAPDLRHENLLAMGTIHNDSFCDGDADTLRCVCIRTMSTGAKAVEPHYTREMLESTHPGIDWQYWWCNRRILRLNSCDTPNCLYVECANEYED